MKEFCLTPYQASNLKPQRSSRKIKQPGLENRRSKSLLKLLLDAEEAEGGGERDAVGGGGVGGVDGGRDVGPVSTHQGRLSLDLIVGGGHGGPSEAKTIAK